MNEPVRWGIAGFGWVAQDYMAPAIAEAGQSLVAVCDPDPAARARATAAGLAAHLDVAGLVADPAVEAVYVATPNHLHRPMVEAAAAVGKAVLCEKPMASTLVDAQAMAAACRSASVLYGTAFDQRHHPAHRLLREQLLAGRLGTVTTVRIAYACWLGENWRADAGDNWRIDAAKAGGGAVMDLAPHGLDLVDFLVGEPLVDLHAMMQRRAHAYGVDDGGVLIGRTASGVLASLHVAYNCPEELPRRRLEVLGTRGQFTATNTMGQDAGGALAFTDGATGAVVPLDVPGGSPFADQVRAFSRAVRGTGDGGFDLNRDLHTMRLLEGAYRTAGAAGRPQSGPGRIEALPAAPVSA